MNPALSQHLMTLGLKRSPFPPTPDAASYYSTARLESELIEATQALRMRAGFVLLTGEVGTGKSTFLRRLLDQLENDGMAVSLVFNTFLQGDDLLAAVLRDFGLTPMGNPAGDIELLNRFLIERWKKRTGCVLIIDDAQNLSPASLELVRLLTNLETDQEKLLQIVLSGQPELRDNLALPKMRQLTSRICKHVQLEPLTLEDSGHYVKFRLAQAGAGESIEMQKDAIAALYQASQGNPRRIHLIMDRSLYGLYGQPQEKREVTVSLIRQAAREAGALPLQNKARVPLALAASVAVAAGLAMSAGLYWGSSAQTGATTVATLPTVPDQNLSSITSASVAPTLQCNTAEFNQAASVPQSTALLLRDSSGLCVSGTNGKWSVHWTRQSDASANEEAGTALLELQQGLRELGQYDGPVDGLYGHLTGRALTRIQHMYGLPATGTATIPTAHLLKVLRAASPTNSTSDPTRHGNG